MLTPNQQKSSKNQQKQEKKNLPVEANEKSTINIPENPLQLGWPEISKPSFFFSWPPSQAQRIPPLAPEKSPWSSLESSPSPSQRKSPPHGSLITPKKTWKLLSSSRDPHLSQTAMEALSKNLLSLSEKAPLKSTTTLQPKTAPPPAAGMLLLHNRNVPPSAAPLQVSIPDCSSNSTVVIL